MPDVRMRLQAKALATPKGRVVALAGCTEAISRAAGKDPADGTMALLTAAVLITARHSGQPLPGIARTLAECLGHALAAADDFFQIAAQREKQH